MNEPACTECRAIAQEILDAYREAWDLGSEAFREAWAARNRLIGGTEQDVFRAEEAFAKVQPSSSARIGDALHRLLVHRVRTGHRLRGRR